MVDKDFVEDFEEEETLLAHVDANQGWEIDIDTLVDRVAGVATRSYEERMPRDNPHIAGEFVPVNSNAVIVEALLLFIQETCVDLEGDGNLFVGTTSSCWGGQRWLCGGARCVRGSYSEGVEKASAADSAVLVEEAAEEVAGATDMSSLVFVFGTWGRGGEWREVFWKHEPA